MPQTKKPPILIVGAGVTGMTLGCVLARHGVHFRIVDKLAEIRPHARAVGVHSRTLEIFQDLGIVDAIVDRSVMIGSVNQVVEGKETIRGDYKDVAAPFPFLANLEQWKTEGVLEQKLAEVGVTVERETELVAIEERLDGVRATLRLPDGSSEVVDTPWLVACDGAHSTVRHLNHQHFPGETDPRRYIIADVLADAPYARDEMFFFICESGFLGWAPLPEGRTLVFANFDESADRNSPDPMLSDLQTLVDARSPEKATVSDPRWLGWYWTNYRLSPHYRHGRTLLAGDAVHIHSSIGGQGMNTGIHDAYNLGWKLALVSQGRAPESLLDSYEKERRAIGEDLLATTKGMASQMFSFGELSEEERDRRYRHAHLPDADRLKSIRHAAQLDLDYRKSPISVDHIRTHPGTGGADDGPHAGAEAVDVQPLEVAGRPRTLFELIAGPHLSLFIFAEAAAQGRRHANAVHLAEEVARVYGDLIHVHFVLSGDADLAAFEGASATIVRDVEARMHERYAGQAGHCYLIRPDGFVGWRCDRPSLIDLRDYLARVLVSG